MRLAWVSIFRACVLSAAILLCCRPPTPCLRPQIWNARRGTRAAGDASERTHRVHCQDDISRPSRCVRVPEYEHQVRLHQHEGRLRVPCRAQVHRHFQELGTFWFCSTLHMRMRAVHVMRHSNAPPPLQGTLQNFSALHGKVDSAVWEHMREQEAQHPDWSDTNGLVLVLLQCATHTCL